MTVSWFYLDVAHINILPERVYNYEIREQFRYHSHSKEIDISEIENLLYSKFLKNLKKDLSINQFEITFKDGDERLSNFKKFGIKYRVLPAEERYGKEKSQYTRFEQGILDKENQFLITEKKLQPAQVASMANGNYSALADPELFNLFDKKLVKDQLYLILFNIVTGTSGYSGYFHNPVLLPGNLLRLFSDTDTEVKFEKLFNSFKMYMELSMFSLSEN